MPRVYWKEFAGSMSLLVVMVGLLSCAGEEGESALCQGLTGEDEILCLRPDLVGKVLERNIAIQELYASGRSDIAGIEKRVHQSSAEVFDYCVREYKSRALCLDEWLQAEIDQTQIEMSKPDEG